MCHNTKVVLEKNLLGAPAAGVYYGPTGKKSPAHKTAKSVAMTRALFCGQCHGIYTPPDGDFIGCNTLYGSHQDAYRGNGGAETCQDCHMRAANRGHKFPGAYEVDIVREGIGLDIEGDHRMGAWQIKEILDLTLPPRKTTKEQFMSEMPEGTKSADVEIKVTYYPSPKIELPVHTVVKKVTF